MSSLILDSIYFYYPDLKVLRGCYLAVPSGKIICLIGRNGSGKSTLFKIASGQLQADSGITSIAENRLHKKSKADRFKHLSYLSQKPFLPKSLKVKQVIDQDLNSQDEFLKNILETKIKDLSTGERRYIEVLFALSLKRKFILLDEPFTGVSPVLIEKVIGKILQAAKRGAGILISDHYMRYIHELGDEFHLLENGQIKRLDQN